jgi:hypothetical protein
MRKSRPRPRRPDRVVADWPIDKLKEHFEALREADRQAYSQRFEAQEKAVVAALAAAKEAVIKAEVAAEKRFESQNEFRSQLKDQAGTLASKEYVDAATKNVEQQIGALAARVDESKGRRVGLTQGLGYVLAAVTAVVSFAAYLSK